MTMGAERAEAQPLNGNEGWQDLPADRSFLGAEVQEPEPQDDEAAERGGSRTWLAALLVVLSAAWIGTCAYLIWREGPAMELARVVRWAPTVSIPLILIGVIWLLFGRSTRRETERFSRAVAAMRGESQALESVLAIVATRLEENQTRLSGEASKLMALGDEASDRLGRVTHYLSRQAAELDKKSQALEAAAANAKVDIGVLLHDLPRAEEQARGVASAMAEAGMAAHGQAGALEGQLAALVARGREADEVVGSAAQRLGAQLARIESNAVAATHRMEQASSGMAAAVDGAMERAAESVETTRAGIEAQGAAMLAMVEQSRAAFDEAGAEASRAIAERLERVRGELAALAEGLGEQDRAGQALVAGLSTGLAEIERRFAELAASGSDNGARLETLFNAVRSSVQQLDQELAAGHDRAGALVDRSQLLIEVLATAGGQLRSELPEALAEVEAQAGRTRAATDEILPALEASRSLSGSLQAIEGQIDGIGNRMATQDQFAAALVNGLARDIAAIDEKFALLAATGSGTGQRVSQAIEAVRTSVEQLQGELAGGEERAAGLIGRAQEIGEALGGLSSQLRSEMPQALAEVETQADRAREATEALMPSLEASDRLSASLQLVGNQIAGIAQHISAQERAGRTLAAGLANEAALLEDRFASLGRSGSESGTQLAAALETVRASVQQLQAELESGNERADTLTERAEAMAASLGQISARLEGDVPAALRSVEEQADRTGRAALAVLPTVEAVQGASAVAAERLGEAEQSVIRQQEALDALLARLEGGLAVAEEQLLAIGRIVGETDEATARMSGETGPLLIDALVRVREAAHQAAGHARDAIAAVIPQSVAALAEASRDAVGEAVTEPVQDQIAQLRLLSEGAVAVARKASERLTRQLLTIGETASAIEARIEETRAEREEKEGEGMSRRVALLIESLNSTAIDVTKLLSNEVTDSAWTAYLKGDRGVFTRRAVRLLESGEAREIVRHYEEEPEFREQVNRYIHDFESMLRRVLADRDGTPLGITLLSSDMGKLYVALAQAIERLRT
jgi:uncharacterized protein YoxC